MIDQWLMKSMRVDPQAKTVQVDAGCTSGDVDHATHAFGLAVPFGIVSSTGIRVAAFELRSQLLCHPADQIPLAHPWGKC